MRLKHQHARKPAHPIDVRKAPGRWLNLVCHFFQLQFSLACNAPPRPAPHARSLGRADSHRSVVLRLAGLRRPRFRRNAHGLKVFRSEEHTSELQSQSNLVCRLLLEKKKKKKNKVKHEEKKSTQIS